MEEHENVETRRKIRIRRRSALFLLLISDSDDEQRVSEDFASIFAMAEMQGGAGVSSSTSVAKEKKKICALEDFSPPTQDDVDWNVVVEKEKLLEKTCAYKQGKKLDCKVLVGQVAKNIALACRCTRPRSSTWMWRKAAPRS